MAIIFLRLDLFMKSEDTLTMSASLIPPSKSVKVLLKVTGEILPVMMSTWTPEMMGTA